MNFEREPDRDGDRCVLFLPADPAHTKFRSYLQNLLFSLSVLEGREPIDIAKEMASLLMATGPSSASLDRSVNASVTTIGVALMGRPSSQFPITSSSLLRWLLEHLPKGDPSRSERLTNRFCFAAGDPATWATQHDGLLRSLATFICGIVHAHPDTESVDDSVFELVRVLLSQGEMTIPAVGSSGTAIVQIAKADDPETPIQLLEWLRTNACPMPKTTATTR